MVVWRRAQCLVRRGVARRGAAPACFFQVYSRSRTNPGGRGRTPVRAWPRASCLRPGARTQSPACGAVRAPGVKQRSSGARPRPTTPGRRSARVRQRAELPPAIQQANLRLSNFVIDLANAPLGHLLRLEGHCLLLLLVALPPPPRPSAPPPNFCCTRQNREEWRAPAPHDTPPRCSSLRALACRGRHLPPPPRLLRRCPARARRPCAAASRARRVG